MDPKLAALSVFLLLFSPDDPPGRAADQAALKPFAGLVGEWKGTGQPQRGSARGAWTESADWSWKLTNDSAALAYSSPKGKYLRSAVLHPAKEKGEFLFDAVLADGSKRSLTGKIKERGALALVTPGGLHAGLDAITITPLHDTRFLMLLEDEKAGRLGEVGFTRQGVAFAAGDASPVCIVTEGRGTIAVAHKGKTYYVCCSGCRDLFKDDPEGVLAEADRRAKAKAQGK
jgi:YHS domain-containing protein